MFLSYLPEAGQYSSFFLYLRQVGNVCLIGLEHEENQRLGSVWKYFGENSIEKKKCVDLLLVLLSVDADMRGGPSI